jgi:hypothetical protein
MRAKVLAASVVFVVCVSATAAQAGAERAVMGLMEMFGLFGRSTARAALASDFEASMLARRAYGSSDVLNGYSTSYRMIRSNNPELAKQMYGGSDVLSSYRGALSSYREIDPELAKKMDEILADKIDPYNGNLKSMNLTDRVAGTKDSITPSQDSTVAARAGKMTILLDGTIAAGATYCGLTECYEPVARSLPAELFKGPKIDRKILRSTSDR